MEKHFYYVSTRYKDSCDKNKVVFDSVLERCVTLLPSSQTTRLHLHQDPFPCAALVFKTRLLGKPNFLAGKIGPFFQILIFSYPPFRLV